MLVRANAKINLSLDITGIRDDGYHNLDTVMQTISLYDEIDLSKNKEGKINLSCTRMLLPCDKKNTAYKAARLILDYAEISGMGVNIDLIKNIPCQAGLGGGSADAAAVLKGINELFKLHLSQAELLKLAIKIGADVPFCLVGGTRRCVGVGEVMSTVPAMPKCHILVCKPPNGIETSYAYAESDKYPQDGYFMTPYIVDSLVSGNLAQIAENLSNRFDDILHVPEVQIIKSLMIEHGALNASMTGSGSAVFGIFTDETKMKASAKYISQMAQVFMTNPCEI